MKKVVKLETKERLVKLQIKKHFAFSRAKKDTGSIIDKLASIIEKSHMTIEPYGTENF